MYTVTPDNNVIRIRLIKKGRNKNRITVCSILSPENAEALENEVKSLWGQVHYDLHISEIYESYEAAKKAAFIGKLS